MTYLNPICADVGTRNCPCPLAETGDCLVCSRLSGRRACDCRWAGVCVYNEYIQNGSKVRAWREDRSTEILQRLWRGDDLVLLQLAVPRGFALEASQPGSFLFLKAPGASELTNVPVSVMAADAEHGSIWGALKILSAKTKALAACEEFLEVRGVYRSGLLGKGLAGMQADRIRRLDSGIGEPAEKLQNSDLPARKRWLILTKGVGFAPAINLLRWAAGRIDVHVIADPEKVGEDVIREQFGAWQPEAHRNEGGRFRLEFQSLAKLLEQPAAASPLQQTDSIATALHTSGSHDPDLNAPCLQQTDYDRIFLLASDYYIKRLSAVMKIPPEKLVFCNNFHLCCGEGICGACGHVDAEGNLRKMCKCREFSALDLLLPE